ncbi:DUF2779 domain-containing protein [Dehalococcoides mccartyi]|uniref:DUF2779 domain-containing protein n=1 Tax=Dehalococcoides mccartyi TaxID=61435 RepID=UPI0002B7723D|nr:DUF2779 domain-containing protein [Dehalococcoides mccartyi]AGG05707.1 hypothetical protein dcmb_74 [Dehalococcoides mccartyi DCMB5]AGG07267.1 hypothetical protein btf_158 [Dehalococcoides mccartyi BTF08]AOV98759.1 hypothetical protein DCWBC2_0083 [Dehalococcoides mccartyi]AQU05422.1 hypothetical protein B1777_01555 [Dehalococcoides mccartyi]POZ59250.1 hypothetical protein C1O63_0563 [Dehalococcoides mccartyi]
MKRKLLSKSKYLNGLQCQKYLWLLFNDKDKVPQPDASTQHVFAEGHRIGELAKNLFPDGIECSCDDLIGNLNNTRQALKANRPLFEAGFYVDGYFSRLDILNPVGDGIWDIYEVKGSTSVKPVNIEDVAFQRHCAQLAGLEIRKCFVVHLNNQYVKNGDIDLHQLFTIEDVTEFSNEVSDCIIDRSEKMWEVIASPTCPDIGIGPHCSDPYDCPVTWCRECLPEHNIFDLYRGGKKCFDMFNEGILFVKDIPKNYKLSAAQKIQQSCEISGEPSIDRYAIQEFIESLNYPLYYLDFETFSPAIPIYDGSRPYQRIPFQFSLHVVKEPGKNPDHYGYLADGTCDPRPGFLEKLKEHVGDTGNIITYNMSFEKGVLKELGEAFPEYSDWIEETLEQVIDLYAPFRGFSYYHPMQQGSASIKKVLPVLTGKGYDGMDIGKGDDASLAFFNIVMRMFSEEEIRKVRQDLEKYCALDTEGMIWIVEELSKLVSGTPV